MTQNADIIDQMLMRYAAGTLNPAEALVIAVHAALNDAARARVRHYEALGGGMICAEEPAPVSRNCLDGLLEKIGNCKQEHETDCGGLPAAAPAHLPLPPAAYAVIAESCCGKSLQWRRVAEGIEALDLKLNAPRQGCCKKLRLMRLSPAQVTPAHGHRGTEFTLVLTGSYQDGDAEYRTGELAIVEEAEGHHAPRAGQDGCICLTLTDGPLRFGGHFHRMMNVFLRF